MKILIAEDDMVSRKLLDATLKSWGHEVIVTEDGAQAWERFEEGVEIDMAILDWMMQGVDGLDLCKRLRARLDAPYIYVILLTARGRKEDIAAGLNAGADDYMIKPFHREELRGRLEVGRRVVELERALASRIAQLNAANARMRRDLETAAEVQKALLPAVMPDSDLCRFAWIYRPCDEVAGDIMNVFRLDEDQVGFYVLDVSGHGVPSALLSVLLSRQLSPESSMSSLLKRKVSQAPGYVIVPPEEVVSTLNSRFPMNEQTNQYFTILYGILDSSTREIRYVCAGHPHPIVLKSDGTLVEDTERTNPAVGWFPDLEYQAVCLELDPGDRIYMFSDGVLEAMNHEMEQFGRERVVEILLDNHHEPMGKGISEVQEQVEAWKSQEDFQDDFTILAIEMLDEE